MKTAASIIIVVAALIFAFFLGRSSYTPEPPKVIEKWLTKYDTVEYNHRVAEAANAKDRKSGMGQGSLSDQRAWASFNARTIRPSVRICGRITPSPPLAPYTR